MKDQAPAAITELLADESLTHAERVHRLLPLVYDELRRLARRRMASERPDHALQATALVHEAYLRLIGEANPRWRDRSHFFAAAAEAMRRILVDQARRRNALKRGGGRQRSEFDGAETEAKLVTADPSIDLAALDEAITALEADDGRKATLVKLRYSTGLTLDQAATALDISAATADRDWAYAKAFLYAEIRKRRSP
ncbi:MAG: ECF-type sigma factor [Planctomycetota bacterium]|nr:ECF-type sigma factor [Planctomycetota bacterium]